MSNPFLPGLLSRLPQSPRKVVLLRASRIGDFICATPAFRALRMALPDAEITMITLPMLRDLVVRSPHLDRFIAFPGFPGIAEQFFDAHRAVAFFQQMQAEQFDLAIQMQGSGVNSNPFMLLLGARATAGFIRQGDTPGRLDAALLMPENCHEVLRMLALTTFLGALPQDDETEFPLWQSDISAAEMLLSGAEQPLIGLHMGARDLTRRWSFERFAALAGQLQSRHGGTIVIVGEAEDWPVGEKLAEDLKGPYRNLAGKTSLPELGAVIQRLAVLVTNDTGPAHIAYALRTPAVTIFGGADPRTYAPLLDGSFRPLVHEVSCRPCGYTTCPIGYKCLEGVSGQQALEAAEEVMRRVCPQSNVHEVYSVKADTHKEL
ncbi:MAG TPA: glycosyltransferase family 9 protein [Ktedonobacteraceae bacterium]|nr:glycosyltransferase family 9 protein [Ktedonobacteraceae bacterium]